MIEGSPLRAIILRKDKVIQKGVGDEDLLIGEKGKVVGVFIDGAEPHDELIDVTSELQEHSAFSQN